VAGVPLVDPGPDLTAKITSYGARPHHLYQALANAPDLLDAWLDFAWRLRLECRTPRRLRELVILRTAVVQEAAYEWQAHREMAARVGVPEEQVRALDDWRTAAVFDNRERAALALADGVMRGNVDDDVLDEVDVHFDAQERVELTLTASFYAMVARTLDALRVPLEDD
jgi:alkylhydroperoxidase family enzyme